MIKTIGLYSRRLFIRRKGQGMVEYGMILALIALALTLALQTLGGHLGNFFISVAEKITAIASS